MYPKAIYIIQFFVLYLIRYLPSGLKETDARDVNAEVTSAGEGVDEGAGLIDSVEGEGGGGGRAGGENDTTAVFSTDGSGATDGGDGGNDIPRLDDTSGGLCGGSDIQTRKSDCDTAGLKPLRDGAGDTENNIIICWGKTSISTRAIRKSRANTSTRVGRNGKLRFTEGVQRHFELCFMVVLFFCFYI